MRLLLFIIIVYLAYRAGKAWLMRNLGKTFQNSRTADSQLDDIMIKDPMCGVYFPRREGVALNHGGQTLIFCSSACRDRYLEQHK